MPVVGFLSLRSGDDTSDIVAAFQQGLNEIGYFEHRNVAIEYRWAANQVDRLQSSVTELVSRPVSVIAAFGTVPAQTAKAASTGIPIVFLTADDPVTVGIVPNLSRPGGNVTGVTFVSAILGAKRLELLRALAPRTSTVGVLVDLHSTESQNQSRDVQEAARALAQHSAAVSCRSVKCYAFGRKQGGTGSRKVGLRQLRVGCWSCQRASAL
jgi:putative tryptophan/tyrosine transport system substrate-binding protein